MPEHHPKNVTGILKWCGKCKRYTMHRVDFKREGSCTECKVSGETKKQEKLREAREQAEKNPTFEF